MTQRASRTQSPGRQAVDYTDRTYWNGLIKMSLSKFFILCVLQTRPMHGYEITRAVERTTNGCCSPAEGTIYPVLQEFEQGGYVTAHTEVVHGRQRKIYAMTDRGRAAFQVAVDAWMEVTQCLVQHECVTGEATASGGRPVGKFFLCLYIIHRYIGAPHGVETMMHNLPMASLVRSAALTVTGSSGRRAVVERRHAVAKGAYSSTRLIGMPRRVTVRARRHHPWVMVWTMAVAQVISWGTLFYAFSLFVVPMHESLGWSRPLLNGALSLGLLGTGVVGFPSEPGLTVTVAEVS